VRATTSAVTWKIGCSLVYTSRSLDPVGNVR
jgi:hypothetical protein